MKIISILIINFLLVWSSFADVTGVSGTVSDAEVITITGADFGANGPNVVLYDDFESGINGNSINTGTDSATYGEWNTVGATPIYSNITSVSGSLSFRADMATFWLEYAEALVPASTTDIFISWWLYLPSGDNYPGETGSSINWKQMWIQGASSTDDDLVTPTRLGPSSWYINGNDSIYKEYTTVTFSKGVWKNMQTWVKGGTESNDGAIKFWDLTSSGLVQRKNDIDVNVLFSGGAFERVRINGYGRATANCHPTFDDVYIASGQYAQARVMIGNESTLSACTNLAVCTPTSWSDTSITATVNQGSFESEENAFIYIYDSDGVSLDGYPIIIGEAATGPGRSNGSPTGVLESGTTNTDISLDTDSSSTCKYDIIPDTAYVSMPNTFSTTGGASHSQNVTGLTDGEDYSYYVKCDNGEVNTTDYLINFSVANGSETITIKGADTNGACINCP